MNKKNITILLLLIIISAVKIQTKGEQQKLEYKMRKFSNVKKFYNRITAKTIELSIEKNIPPAAILAIAGLESGYGSGYISKITGNILSLGARKGEKELKALYLPRHIPSGNILYDTTTVKNYNQADIIWEKRPSSLKKDYRPAEIAGTANNLTYYKQHPDEELKSNLKCITEFTSDWINENSPVAAYKEAKILLNKIVKTKGKKALFSYETNKLFLETISGKPRSFNHRKSWIKKVDYIIINTGLCDLTYDIYINNKTFPKAWAM